MTEEKKEPLTISEMFGSAEERYQRLEALIRACDPVEQYRKSFSDKKKSD